MKRITLVGCGEIGSRHLQGLVKLQDPTLIDIVEPNEESKKRATSRLNELSIQNVHTLSWYSSVNDLKNVPDLVIVATTAAGRVEILTKLLEIGCKMFLIEKMVCQSAREYEMLLNAFKSYGAKGWVNTPRRYYPVYQKIKKSIQNSELIHLSITAGNMGLGTNAIHLLDLFSWLLEDFELKLDGEFLYNELFLNKRGNDLVEFAGTVVAYSKNQSFLSITFLPYDNIPFIIDISTSKMQFVINETSEKIFVSNDENNLNLKFETQFQSNLTTQIVDDIFNHDRCLLPTLQESFFAHNELFRIFNTHIKKISNEQKTLCPIT